MSQHLKIFLILFFIGLIAYANSLHSPFMLDDYGFFNQFQSQGLLNHFVPDIQQHAYYRPLALIIPHLNFLLFGNNPLGYHVVNIILLAMAAGSIVLLLSSVMPVILALGVGVVFILHPINGMMVNYITASVFAVQVICMCLALYYESSKFKVQSSKFKENAFALSFKHSALSVIFFTLALLCHETSFMIPFYAVILLLMKEFDFKKALFASRWLWLTLIVYMLSRMFIAPLSQSLFHSIATNGLTWDQGLASILQLLIWYIQKLFIPIDIFLMWSKPFIYSGSIDYIVFFGGVCLILGLAVKSLWQTHRMIVLFCAWFLIGLLPVGLGAFAMPLMGALLEPHWFIPATIGLFAALILLGARAVPSTKHQKIIFGLICSVLLIYTWRNNALWSDEAKLYERWSLADPEFKAIHFFQGTVYKRQGRLDEARKQLSQSLIGRKKDWIVYLNLAQIDLMQGKIKEARANVEEALQREPRQTDIFNTLGAIEYHEQNWKEARRWFNQAIEANPYNQEPRRNLELVNKQEKH